MDKESLGFGNQKTNNRIKLNEITLDGEDGVFNYKKFAEEKNEDGTYKYEKLPVKSFSGVILAIRRKLQEYNDAEEKMFVTNEFNSNQEEITFYGSNGAEKGTAETLRLKYPKLKTLAVVYFYSPKKDEMVRLNCKGLGLQQEDNKGVNYKGLFQYLSSFDEGENPSEYMTTVLMTEKEVTKGKKTKKYFAMRFEKGEVIEDAEIKFRVIELQKEVLSQFKKDVTKEAPKAEAKSEIPVLEYPSEETEGISIDDINF